MTMELLMLLICLTVLPAANGCGQLQPGRAAMVYYEDPTVRTKESTISTSKSEAETFVRQLIMQSVEDVLYQQGRSALSSSPNGSHFFGASVNIG